MVSQGDQGLETEMLAIERMRSGNAEFRAWAQENRPVMSQDEDE